jgi:hypothetical protein
MFGFMDHDEDEKNPEQQAAEKLAREQTAAGGPPRSLAMDPTVAQHVARKDPSLWEKYQQIAGDKSAIDSASGDAKFGNAAAGVLQGLSTMFAGKKHTDSAAYDRMRETADAKVAQARADQKEKLDNLLMQDKLQRQDMTRGREDEEYGRKTTEYNDLNTKGSERSKLYSGMAVSRLKQLQAEATKAGDQAGAAQLAKLGEDIGAGNYSAAQIGQMSLLDKADYKDILNNQAAMQRLSFQEGQANKRAADSRDAEDRRVSNMKFQREETLRKQISTDPTMKEAAATQMALSKLEAMANENNGIGDEAVIMNWQKALDPGSVVRESEFGRTTAGAGLLNNLQMALSKAAGQGRLTPELREQINSAMRELRNAHSSYAKSKLGVVDSAIREYGLTPENVYGSFHSDLREPAAKGGASPAVGDNAAPKAPAAFPRSLTRINPKTGAKETATVSDEAELNEASAEGFK